ncbi:MAG: mechanosensitive ion channel protein, partial [Rhodoferax sp.]|nr:mechanosensitive ion channel protein [Rhodoferax sp.]
MSETRVPDLDAWIASLTQPAALIELGALASCAVIAWAVAALVCRTVGSRGSSSIMFGKRIVDGVLFPLLLLCLAYLAQALLVSWVPLAVFKIAMPVLISLLVIRLGVKVLQAAFMDRPLVRVLERTISWVAWLAMVLWVSG